MLLGRKATNKQQSYNIMSRSNHEAVYTFLVDGAFRTQETNEQTFHSVVKLKLDDSLRLEKKINKNVPQPKQFGHEVPTAVLDPSLCRQ